MKNVIFREHFQTDDKHKLSVLNLLKNTGEDFCFTTMVKLIVEYENVSIHLVNTSKNDLC